MSDCIQNMLSRRSVRKYKPDMLSKETIDKIIEAGLYAPSGMDRQPVIIVAVTNKEVRDRLSALNAGIMGAEGTDPFYGAPVVLIVLADRIKVRRLICMMEVLSWKILCWQLTILESAVVGYTEQKKNLSRKKEKIF